MTRVLIVGLDGATFDILRPLAEQGRLPNLQRMLDAGAAGVLQSTIPPVTPAAWTSLFTGKNPGKHGIYDFQDFDLESYTFSPLRTDMHREKTLWQLLGEAGLRSIIWDVPFTYPPRPLEGWMLTGYGTPRVPGTVFTHPADLVDRVPAELRAEIRVALPNTNFDRSQAFIDSWWQIMEGRERLLSWLIDNQPWDLFSVVFSITDTMAHVFWTYVDPAHPNYLKPEAPKFREAFFGAYERCDRILGQLRERAGEDVVTLVMSDHGFGSVRPRQYIFRRLMERGDVRTAGGKLTPRNRLMKWASGVYLRFPFLREWVKGLAPGSRKALTKSLTGAGLMPGRANLDNAGSNVIPTNFGLRMWVNDRSRFPGGPIPAEAREDFVSELIEYLVADRDPINGRPILNAVHRGEDLYHGPSIEKRPDLVIEYANHFEFEAEATGDNPHTEGGHTLQGILLAAGGPVVNAVPAGASLIDLAPTVLHLFGLPVPPDMDGRVLEEIFSPEYLAAHPVRVGEEPAVREAVDPLAELTAEEQAEVDDQLRKLGYI